MVSSPGLSPLRSIGSEAPRGDHENLAAQNNNENDGLPNPYLHLRNICHPGSYVEAPQTIPNQNSDRGKSSKAWLISPRSLVYGSLAEVRGFKNQSSRQQSWRIPGSSTSSMNKRFKNRWKVLPGSLPVATFFALLNTPPQFNDRPIKYWIEALYHLNNSKEARTDLGFDQLAAPPGSEPRQAMRYFGADAIPLLLREIGKRETHRCSTVQTHLQKFDGMLPTPISYPVEPQGIRRHRGLIWICIEAYGLRLEDSKQAELRNRRNASAKSIDPFFIVPDRIP